MGYMATLFSTVKAPPRGGAVWRGGLMDYQQFYNLVVKEEELLKAEDILNDYRLCKALAACYELQDYLAGKLGEMVERGEIDDY